MCSGSGKDQVDVGAAEPQTVSANAGSNPVAAANLRSDSNPRTLGAAAAAAAAAAQNSRQDTVAARIVGRRSVMASSAASDAAFAPRTRQISVTLSRPLWGQRQLWKQRSRCSIIVYVDLRLDLDGL